jgi:hypothetical protein
MLARHGLGEGVASRAARVVARGRAGRGAAGLGVMLAAAILMVAGARAGAAQVRPGVGYDAKARGLTISQYVLDDELNPFTLYVADFTALPGEAGARPNEYYFDLGDAAVSAAYERRWGPGTATNRMKRWAGPSNEVRFIIHDALVYLYKNHPDQLGGDPSNRNGEPTQTEITDVAAFSDARIWTTYIAEALPGFSPAHRVTVCDATQPSGDGVMDHPFWHLPYYFHNDYQRPAPFSPQVPVRNNCTPSGNLGS